MTICRNSKKPNTARLSKYWKTPPDGNAAFVADVDNVLVLHPLPYAPIFPVVCMDESNKQLMGEVHEPRANGVRTNSHRESRVCP